MFTTEDFKIYHFEKDKFYLILCEPSKIDFSQLEKLEIDFDVNILFVPCRDPSKSTVQLKFDTVRAIEDWLEELKLETL